MNKRDRALQKAVELIKKPECRILAIKLEVLLPLPLWQEDDLYALMEDDVRRMAGLTGPVDFPAIRRSARGKNLAEIYDDLSARVLGADIRPLAERERVLRMSLPTQRRDVLHLIHVAAQLGKPTILWSGMPRFLTQADVERMLSDRHIPRMDGLYIDHWGSDITATGTLILSDEKERSCWKQIVVPSPVAALRDTDAPHEALRYPGYRTMLAMTAMQHSVHEPDPDAYGAFGMYLLSNAMWLADETCRSGFERINFLARDGHLLKQAFDLVRDALQLPVETGYVRISRQAVFPLHFRKEADLLSLPVLLDVAAHTPRTLLNLFAPVTDMTIAPRVMREYGFDPDEQLDGESVMRFIDAYRARLFDPERFAEYRALAAEYLTPLFKGKCATVDVGYNLRSEAVIRDVTGADVTAFITHTDSALADRRGVEYRTLYGQSPWVSWVAREQFLLEDAPLCLRYGVRGPVLAGDQPVNCPAIAEFQRQGIAFVQDMVSVFGEDLARLYFRPVDGCAPFEQFLLTASRERTEDFRASRVENAFLEGAAAGDDPVLQWRLMQTDARRESRFIRKMRRAFIRMNHSPKALIGKIKRTFTPKKRRE